MKKRWPFVFAPFLVAIGLFSLARFTIQELNWLALKNSFEPTIEIEHHSALPLEQELETPNPKVAPIIPDESKDIDSGFSIQVPEELENIDPGISIPAPTENIDPAIDGSANDNPDIIIVAPGDSAEAGHIVEPNEIQERQANITDKTIVVPAE